MILYYGHFDLFDHFDHFRPYCPFWYFLTISTILIILTIFYHFNHFFTNLEITLARANTSKFSILFLPILNTFFKENRRWIFHPLENFIELNQKCGKSRRRRKHCEMVCVLQLSWLVWLGVLLFLLLSSQKCFHQLFFCS